ncbi:hypothetical protein [Lichenicoccus sp.]|uniref:hypothetical protein n=1 Tax=Lichenicoccus sp. TaxID=2781899 RepID=UPI003D0D4792
MRAHASGLLLGGALAFSGFAATSAHALSTKECSAKYQAAKAAGTLNGETWKTYRVKECGAVASAGATPAATADTVAPALKSGAGGAAPAAATGPLTFPSAVDAKYAKETAGKARMHTCLDQYHANKAGTGNGGLKWIQKGGGYYSACSKKLKG